MNCANHPDRERAAFCQNCGKPLCSECVRNVGSSVFCDPCLAARVAAPQPGYAAPGYPGAPMTPPPVAPGEPNPAVAAFLGFIPGVGAMYNEQYAKGIVHLMVFALLVSLAHDVNGIFGVFIAGWEFYMAIEAHHTARARRDGTPLPNPFGLNDLSERLGFGKAWPGAGPASGPAAYTAPNAANAADPAAASAYVAPTNPYGAGAGSAPYTPAGANWAVPPDASVYGRAYGAPPVAGQPAPPPYPVPDRPGAQRIPAGAIWLIGLGVLFLVANSHVFYFLHGRYLGPLLVIGIGVWVFVQRMTSDGMGLGNDGTPFYHWRLVRAVNSAFWLLLTGAIWFLDEARILSWSRSWPLFLIGAGIMMFVRRTVYMPGYAPGPMAPPQPPPAAGTEIVPAARSVFDSGNSRAPGDEEGR